MVAKSVLTRVVMCILLEKKKMTSTFEAPLLKNASADGWSVALVVSSNLNSLLSCARH